MGLRARRLCAPAASQEAVGALRLVGIDGVVLTVRKNPEGLSAYLNDHGIDPRTITEPRTLYEGDVETAVKLFPANVNVAATLALASNSDVKVRVVVDPSLKRNVHEIEVISHPSNLRLRFENLPHPDNPKTSYLAALSAARLLQRIVGEELQIGTQFGETSPRQEDPGEDVSAEADVGIQLARAAHMGVGLNDHKSRESGMGLGVARAPSLAELSQEGPMGLDQYGSESPRDRQNGKPSHWFVPIFGTNPPRGRFQLLW